jgi:hypothetical protein
MFQIPNNRNISSENFSGKAIINKRISSIHSSDFYVLKSYFLLFLQGIGKGLNVRLIAYSDKYCKVAKRVEDAHIYFIKNHAADKKI